MTVENHGVIDLVAYDPGTDTVKLVMVEYRDWAERSLLHDLQEKLNTYYVYALEGQLAKDYPELRGKPVRIALHTVFPLGAAESEFIGRVIETYLGPRGVHFEWKVLGEE